MKKSTKIKLPTVEEIRAVTGMCHFCEIDPVDYFCPECWFGLCEDCANEEIDGKCKGKCADSVPDLGDIAIFDRKAPVDKPALR